MVYGVSEAVVVVLLLLLVLSGSVATATLDEGGKQTANLASMRGLPDVHQFRQERDSEHTPSQSLSILLGSALVAMLAICGGLCSNSEVSICSRRLRFLLLQNSVSGQVFSLPCNAL